MNQDKIILDVRNLNKNFISRHGVHVAVNNVSFKLAKGEIIGLIGQSGSGKSTIANALMRLLPNVNGVVTLNNQVVSGRLSRKKEKDFYRKTQMIFQDPHTSLNEKRNVFSTIAEPLLVHKIIDKETKIFLEKSAEVQTSFKYTLEKYFKEKLFSINSFIADKRLQTLIEIEKEIGDFKIESYKNATKAEIAFSNLVSAYFEPTLNSENNCLAQIIDAINDLIAKYDEVRNKVINKDLTSDELALINSQEALRDYRDSFDDQEINKKVKSINKEKNKVLKDSIDETSSIINAFLLDKKSQIKLYRTRAFISQSSANYSFYMTFKKTLKIHFNAIKQVYTKKLVVPKQELYNFEKEISQLDNELAAQKVVDKYLEIFKTSTVNFISEIEESTSEKIKEAAVYLGSQHVVDPIQIENLNVDISRAKKIYNQELEKFLESWEIYKSDFSKRMVKADIAVKNKLVKTKSKAIKKMFLEKVTQIFAQIEDVNWVRNKRKQLNQQFQKIRAHEIEETQLLKALNKVKVIYQLIKLPSFLRFLVVRNLLLRRKVIDSLVQVGLKPEHAYRYPHEFSGGQKQRINIARALIIEPELIIADEPIASLDISIQAQIINILIDLVRKKGISMIFIGHDLSVVEYIADSILVMHLGRVVEKGFVASVFKDPRHPYTQTLFNSIPKISNANEPFKSLHLDSSYILEYEKDKPSYKIIAPDHLLLANQNQLKKWAADVKEIKEYK